MSTEGIILGLVIICLSILVIALMFECHDLKIKTKELNWEIDWLKYELKNLRRRVGDLSKI